MTVKDDRINTTNEVFTNIKIIKLYAWESAFKEAIFKIRNLEIKFLRRYVFYDASQVIMFTTSPVLINPHPQ